MTGQWGLDLLTSVTEMTETSPANLNPSGRTNTFSGVATGDSTAAPGSWNGKFHGVAGQIGEPEVNTKPAAVTGEFNANFTDGTAAGGFGANNRVDLVRQIGFSL